MSDASQYSEYWHVSIEVLKKGTHLHFKRLFSCNISRSRVLVNSKLKGVYCILYSSVSECETFQNVKHLRM